MSKITVRAQTDDFIVNSPNSLSYETRVESLSKIEDVFLTGAIDPILPMTIAMADKKGKRREVTLLINPENMNHGKTSSVSNAYTRKGYVIQIWGPGQDILTSTGKTAVFMAPKDGLTYANTRKSFAYLNFMSLFNAYRNNGYRLMDPTAIQQGALTRVISVIHGIEIFYDNQIYMGHFNTFTLDETADSPFIMNYNFEFICSSTSNDYRDVRGHFLPIPGNEETSSAYTTQEQMSNIDAVRSGNTIQLVSDVNKYGSDAPIKKSKSISDEDVIRLWTSITGLNWSQAYDLGYTDLTVQSNNFLKTRLLIESWPFNP